MIDVQKHAPEVPIPIDRVGVRGVKVPLWARDRANLKQRTVASVDLSVDLPASFKGTHMSRFVEAIENWGARLATSRFGDCSLSSGSVWKPAGPRSVSIFRILSARMPRPPGLPARWRITAC